MSSHLRNLALRSPTSPPNPISSEFVLREIRLPCDELTDLWHRLVLNECHTSREDLLRSLNVQLHVASEGRRAQYASHGTTLYYGPPGTGKTSLALCVPNALINQLGKKAILLEINTHSLPGAERGACQKNICRLFDQLGEVASAGYPLFCVFNELETLASSRQSISFATNPLDTSFAVNALIESIDCVAARYSNIFFLATTNLPDQVDAAIFDRFDDVFHVDLPDSSDRLRIVAQIIESLQPDSPLAEQLRRGAALKQSRNNTAVLRTSDKKILQFCDLLAKATRGMSPRRLSQLPVRCLGIRSEELPSAITFQQLIEAADQVRRTR